MRVPFRVHIFVQDVFEIIGVCMVYITQRYSLNWIEFNFSIFNSTKFLWLRYYASVTQSEWLKFYDCYLRQSICKLMHLNGIWWNVDNSCCNSSFTHYLIKFDIRICRGLLPINFIQMLYEQKLKINCENGCEVNLIGKHFFTILRLGQCI